MTDELARMEKARKAAEELAGVWVREKKPKTPGEAFQAFGAGFAAGAGYGRLDADEWKSKADELASAVEDALRRHEAGDTLAIKSNMIRATLAAVRGTGG